MISFEMPADPSLVATLCAMVRTFAETKGLATDESRRLELAVDEVASNVILHAYRGDSTQRFRGEMESRDGRIIVRIYDRGPGFDLEKVPAPDLHLTIEEAPVGGRGLFLVRKMTDEIHYQRQAGGENCFTLVKKIKDN